MRIKPRELMELAEHISEIQAKGEAYLNRNYDLVNQLEAAQKHIQQLEAIRAMWTANLQKDYD